MDVDGKTLSSRCMLSKEGSEVAVLANDNVKGVPELEEFLSGAKSCLGNPVLVIKDKRESAGSGKASDLLAGRITKESLSFAKVFDYVKERGPGEVVLTSGG